VERDMGATANLFVDWGSEFHAPPWQANDRLPIVEGQTTAFDLFQSAKVIPPLAVVTQGSGQGVYVTAIDGVIQNAGGNGYWWVYFVNGAEPDVGANAYLLKDGDSVAWDYKHMASGLKQASHPGL
jgi:hypothetical protein